MDGRLSDKRYLDRSLLRENPSAWCAESSRGVVTSAHYRATEAGVEILAQGGNAVDAAVAVSAALGVVEPAASGLGGMTMMMIHLASARRTFLLEGPCLAPVAATPARVLAWVEETLPNFRYDAEKYKTREEVEGLIRKNGPRAIAVPANPAVLAHALDHYGTMATEQVLAPAIRLAENGLAVTPLLQQLLGKFGNRALKEALPDFFHGPECSAASVGDVVCQPALAQTLRRLAKAGFEDFYGGEIGRSIWRDIQRKQGFLSEEDFLQPPIIRETPPIEGTFFNWEIKSAAPPGGGVTLLEMLNLFEALRPETFDPDTPEAALLLSAIIRRARLDRRTHSRGHAYGGPKASPDLSGKAYAESIAPALLAELDSHGETTHFNVADRHGNLVAATQSIERSFGARYATPELGFVYNGFMKGFKLRNKKHPHYLRPGAVARSNASPTIGFLNGSPLFGVGSTGSERMVSGIFQTLVRLRSQAPFDAVKSPRLHCTPEGEVFLEKDRFHENAPSRLDAAGLQIEDYGPWAYAVGGLHLIHVGEDGAVIGIADPRRDGAAMGL